jgi:hypothetical protein
LPEAEAEAEELVLVEVLVDYCIQLQHHFQRILIQLQWVEEEPVVRLMELV